MGLERFDHILQKKNVMLACGMGKAMALELCRFVSPLKLMFKGVRHFLGIVRQLLARQARKGWRKISDFRYLVSIHACELPLYKRIQRFFLLVVLALPDPYYRYRLRKFEKNISQKSSILNINESAGVLVVAGTLGPGGAERQVVLTLKGLVRRGFTSLSLVCVNLQEEWQRFFLPLVENENVPVIKLDQNVSCDVELESDINRIIMALPASLYDVSHFVRTFHARNPKVIHLWLDEINIKGGLAAVASDVPRIVLGLRSLPPCNFALHLPYMREGYRWLAKRPEVEFINNSEAGARAYENWLGMPEGAIRVVRNGFDFQNGSSGSTKNCDNCKDYKRRNNIPTDVFVVGTVMRFSEEKRPHLWIEIAEKVLGILPDVHFLLVGDGPLFGEIKLCAEQGVLSGRVHLVGYEKNVFLAMKAMDIFLLTSRAEGLPNVLIEAQSVGVPVVTTRVGGAAETVDHGVTGWVVDKDDALYVANVLAGLLQDHDWREKARTKAPVFARQAFGLERMLDETIAVYGVYSDS